jgi:hypothetical protein
MKKINKTQRGLWQKVVGVIAGIGALATGNGCIEKGFVTPYMGFSSPVTRPKIMMEYDNSLSYGVRGGVKTKSGIEVEAEANFYETNAEEGLLRGNLKAQELSIGAVVPVWNNEKVTLYVAPRITRHEEDEEEWFVGVPGTAKGSYNSTGYSVGIGARFKAGKGEVDARLTLTETLGEESDTAIESATNLSAGYTFSF